MIWAVALLILFGLIFSGAWLGVALGSTGAILLFVFGGGHSALSCMVSATWNILTSFALTAVPMFIIMGQLIVHTGLAERIYGSLAPLLERLWGGLLQTNIVVCALLGAISGSASAIEGAVGSVAYPTLGKLGYNKELLAASLASSSTLGIIIPPSIPLILYGAWMDVSVAKLFAATLIPGVLMTVFFMIYTAIRCWRNVGLAPRVEKRDWMPFVQALIHTSHAWPLLIIISAVLLTIYLGIATPSESAALGVLAIVILSLFFRTFKWTSVGRALYDSAGVFGMITLVFIGAIVLSIAVSVLGLPRQVVLLVKASGLPGFAILGIIYVVYGILGMFFDTISFLVMTLPFTFPVVMNLGYDPLFFGVAIVMVSMIAMVTPPVGLNLYIMVGLSKGEVKIMQIARECIPYWALIVVGLVAITTFPQLCTWLPSTMS